MKKIIKFGLMLIVIFTIVSSFTYAMQNLGNGEYLITSTEFQNVNNNVIANFMTNNFRITQAISNINTIDIYYNVIAIEPKEELYYIKNIEFKTEIEWTDLNNCNIKHDMNYCIKALVYGTEIYTYDVIDNDYREKPVIDYDLNESEIIEDETIHYKTITYKSTQSKAYAFGLEKYKNAIELKENIIKQTLMNDFINGIDIN